MTAKRKRTKAKVAEAPKKIGRPLLDIDAAQVEQLAAIDCSYAEMGAILGCSPDTLERRFAGVIERGRMNGTSSLKRRQFKSAMDGNVAMLIWLGKNRLGQTDKAAHEVTGANGAPIEVTVTHRVVYPTQRVEHADAHLAEPTVRRLRAG